VGWYGGILCGVTNTSGQHAGLMFRAENAVLELTAVPVQCRGYRTRDAIHPAECMSVAHSTKLSEASHSFKMRFLLTSRRKHTECPLGRSSPLIVLRELALGMYSLLKYGKMQLNTSLPTFRRNILHIALKED
jgi:hypothetical protein